MGYDDDAYASYRQCLYENLGVTVNEQPSKGRSFPDRPLPEIHLTSPRPPVRLDAIMLGFEIPGKK